MRAAAARQLVLAPLLAACFLGLAASPGHAQKRPVKGVAAKPADQPADKALPAAYTVHKGDTLFRIAGKVRPSGATLHQTVLALYKANPDAFLQGRINQLVVGRVLNVPAREAVLAVSAADAAREVRALTAQPPVPVPMVSPPPKEAPAPVPKAEPPKAAQPSPAPAKLNAVQAEERFRLGLALEHQGDEAGALKAFLAAGQAGNAGAQKKLGDLYNTGNAVVERDYETSLKWYQKAREQGVEIPKPLTPGIRR